MIEPSLSLQGAIFAAIKGNTAAGDNVFDKIRPDVYPRIQLGSAQTVSDEPDCVEGVEVFFQVDVYSKAEGFLETKSIAWQLRNLIHKKALPVAEWTLIDLRLDDADYTRDDATGVSRGRMNLRAYMELL